MQIIHPAETIQCSRASLNWDYKDHPGSGCYVPCDEQGNIIADDYHTVEQLQARYAENMANPELVYRGLEVARWTYRQNAIGKCVCGREVELGHFTCPCACGRDYNWGGQLLAPREFWGEETGETLADIEAGDYDPEAVPFY